MGNEEKALANAETDRCRQGRTGRPDPSGARQPQQTLRVLDLFSGIGGFSLGLERVGMRTVAFCEIDPYCRKVLAKHWPDVPIFGDVRELTAETLADSASIGCQGWTDTKRQGLSDQHGGNDYLWGQSSRQSIDLICGGFPCQDISVAGKGAGIEGSRSGLWSEYARIIGEVRPRYVIVENVAAILGRGLLRVLGDLTAIGYDTEWHAIPASHIGAPHRRDRVWIVGYANAERCGWWQDDQGKASAERNGIAATGNVENPAGEGRRPEGAAVAGEKNGGRSFGEFGGTSEISNTGRNEAARYGPNIREISKFDWWLTEPNVGRVAHGVPARVDRLRSLGNAIVPQIAEIIGQAIMEIDNAKS